MTVTITHSARVPVPITILLSGISKAADLAHTLPHTRRQYLTFPVQGSSIWELPKIFPYNKDPTIEGTILGSPILGNPTI